jgi:hypothetical protein
MSSGDKGNCPIKFIVSGRTDEVTPILRLPIMHRMMTRKFVVDSRNWDIRHPVGYSIDGGKIYIDRDLAAWEWLGKQIDTKRFLTLRGHIEKSLIDAIHDSNGRERQRLLVLLRMTGPDDQIYCHCQGVAVATEEYAVKLGHGPSGLKAYNEFKATQVKRAEDERVRRVPANLDITPYRGDAAEDVKLRDAMEKAMLAA